jgi:hypothetical protein
MTIRSTKRQAKLLVLVAFLGLWVGALVFLAQDGCFDRGGALSGSGFACAQSDGSVVSLWRLVSPTLAVSVALLLALPVVLLFHLVGRRIGSSE